MIFVIVNPLTAVELCVCVCVAYSLCCCYKVKQGNVEAVQKAVWTQCDRFCHTQSANITITVSLEDFHLRPKC